MKHFRFILISCMALEAVGVLVFAFLVPLEIQGSEVIAMSPGSESVGHFVIDTEGGGSVAGTYVSDSGREVAFKILDDEQYDDYASGQPYGALVSLTSTSGDFSLDRPAEELYHVVIEHATEPDQPEQVTLNYTVNTMDWNMTAVGTVLLFGSSFVIAGAMIRQNKDKAAARGPMSPYTDVVFFDDLHRK